MFRLPSDFDASALVGCVIESITFAQFSLYINLDNGALITVVDKIEFDGVISEIPIYQSNLMSSIGKKIIKAETNQLDCLILRIEDGKDICVLNSDDNYESYSVKIGSREVVV